MERLRTSARLAAILAWTASVVGGCAQFRVPQIDPSGQRIFLPAPASTTFVAPLAGTSPVTTGSGSFFPRPAWVAPPPPPPCGPLGAPQPAPVVVSPLGPPVCPPLAVVPQVQVPAAPVLPPPVAAITPLTPVAIVGEESLVLSPVRIIAPVGTQVVLLAGLRAPSGQYSPGEPIEWLLSQESVGHFVEVGDGAEHGLFHWRRHAPRKLSNNYAIGRTSRRDQVLTRGNLNPADDVWLMRGQAWLSVSSPSEGVSLVTALAPEAPGWDRRQQTAEIYWVNAQWSLPAPAHVRAGQPHALTTVVTRSTKSEPVAGWIVRYEVAGGAPAAFTQQGDQAIDVVTDAAGAATAPILPQGGASGATQVRIQIIRPGAGPHEPGRLVVGEGGTTVSWSAPHLAVQVTGPASAAVATPLSYRIDVSNPGDMPVNDAVLTFHTPPGFTVLNSEPAASVFGPRVEWTLGSLAPGTAHSVAVNCRADQAGDFNCCAIAQSASANLTAENCLLTRVVQQTITLTLTGPDRAMVGEQAQFRVVIRNAGGAALTGVVVRDDFDNGLEHAQSASPIERDLGDLAPGQEAPLAITFRVTRPGTLCHTMTVATAEGQTASARACLTATEPPPPERNPGVTARAWGEQELTVSQTGSYVLEVSNTGDTPLTAVRAAVSHSASLKAVEATAADNRQLVGGELVWTIDRLDAGAVRRYQVNCQALRPDAQAVVRITVTTREQVQSAAEAKTRIVAAPPAPAPTSPPPVTPPPPSPPPVSPAPTSPARPQTAPAPAAPTRNPESNAAAAPGGMEGQLEISLDDLEDPARMGGSITYALIVKNSRSTADRNVAVTVILPENLRFVRLTNDSPTTIRRASPDGRTLDFAPILEIRPGETLPPFRIEVAPQQPGRYVLRIQATSEFHPQPVTVEEDTTVLAP